MTSRNCLFFVAILFFPCVAAAQDPFCPDEPDPGTPSVVPYVSKNGNACVPGSYVRTGTSYVANFHTTSNGSCAIYNWDPNIPGCYYDFTERQGIGVTSITEVGSSGLSPVYPNPNNGPLQLDTRSSGTSVPDTPTWVFYVEGAERRLNFMSNLNPTACGFPPNVSTQIEFKAVACVPRWLKTPQGHLYHNSTDKPILVRVPPTMNPRMKAGINNAINRWNSALDAYGTSVGARYQYSELAVPCGGTYCVNTTEGPVNLPTECAKGVLDADPATGLITDSDLTFPPQSAGWSQNFVDRLAAHELGHHLGLENNNSNCATANSLMKSVQCNQASGYPTGPTTSDHLPVAKSTYQGGSTLTCE